MKMLIFPLVIFCCLAATAQAQQAPSTNSGPLSPRPAPPPAFPQAAASPGAAGATPGSSTTPQVANTVSITAAESQHLLLARLAALKSDPTLRAQAAEISKKMHEFQEKLDAAIIKTDPNVAPIIARIENTPPGPVFFRPPTPTEHPGAADITKSPKASQ